MRKAPYTHAFDLVVALRLTESAGTLAQIADELAVSPSQVHAALRRLELAGLMRPDQRATNVRALLEFLGAGIRFAFPALRGPLRDGVPTAYSAPPLNAVVDAVDVVVWPAAADTPGLVRGFSVLPLYPKAPVLARRSPRTYRLLSIVDALRLGDARLRPQARAALEAELSRGAS